MCTCHNRGMCSPSTGIYSDVGIFVVYVCMYNGMVVCICAVLTPAWILLLVSSIALHSTVMSHDHTCLLTTTMIYQYQHMHMLIFAHT